MDPEFLQPPQGEDFVANPFAGPPLPGMDTSLTAPVSRFDLTSLLGGPADIAAMANGMEVLAGPLNLEADAGSLAPEPAPRASTNDVTSHGRLPSGDEIGAVIETLLRYATEHVTDRAAFCHDLGHAIAGVLAGDDVPGTEPGRGVAQ